MLLDCSQMQRRVHSRKNKKIIWKEGRNQKAHELRFPDVIKNHRKRFRNRIPHRVPTRVLKRSKADAGASLSSKLRNNKHKDTPRKKNSKKKLYVQKVQRTVKAATKMHRIASRKTGRHPHTKTAAAIRATRTLSLYIYKQSSCSYSRTRRTVSSRDIHKFRCIRTSIAGCAYKHAYTCESRYMSIE